MNKKIILITFLFCITFVSAFQFPFYPNGTIGGVIPDGTLVSIIVYNNSVYLVEAVLSNTTYQNITNQNITYQNITYQNITYENKTYFENTYENITYINTTCLNCSNIYISNYTGNVTIGNYSSNNSIGNYTYDRANLDSRFTGLISDSAANGRFALKGDLNKIRLDLASNIQKTSDLDSGSVVGETNVVPLWITVIALGMLIIFLMVMHFKEKDEE